MKIVGRSTNASALQRPVYIFSVDMQEYLFEEDEDAGREQEVTSNLDLRGEKWGCFNEDDEDEDDG